MNAFVTSDPLETDPSAAPAPAARQGRVPPVAPRDRPRAGAADRHPAHAAAAAAARIWQQAWLRKLVILAALAVLWEIAARWQDNDLLLPTFLQTARALVEGLRTGELLEKTRISLLPLALLWFGLGQGSLVFVLIHSVLWPLALATYAGFQGVPETLRMAGRNYGLTGQGRPGLVHLPEPQRALHRQGLRRPRDGDPDRPAGRGPGLPHAGTGDRAALGAGAVGGSSTRAPRRRQSRLPMIRLYLAVFLVLILLSWAAPWLKRLGLGRLPGDLRFRLFGREWDVPVASTLLIGVVAGAVAKFV